MTEPKSWVGGVLDENSYVIPIQGLLIVGGLSFIAVLAFLFVTDKVPSLPRFTVSAPKEQEQQTVQSKEELLATLSDKHSEAIPEKEKLKVLKSLAERIDSGEERIVFSENQKLNMLASLKTSQ